MKKIVITTVFIVSIIASLSCKQESKNQDNITEAVSSFKVVSIDSTQIDQFFDEFSDLKGFQSDVQSLYKKHANVSIWQDENGFKEFAFVLHHKVMSISEDGLDLKIPHLKEFDLIFHNNEESKLSDAEKDILISTQYFNYLKKAFGGIDEKTTNKLGWMLPRKKIDFIDILDKYINKNEIVTSDNEIIIPQYYKLKEKLEKYREIEKAGGWASIKLPDNFVSLKIGDTSAVVLDIKKRLVLTGDLKRNNKTNSFDSELQKALIKYQKRNNNIIDSLTISKKIINELNVPLSERLQTIVLNMERCRWVDPSLMNGDKYVFVNIPSYKLIYYKDQKDFFNCNVVVGAQATKTVIFSGNMSYIVFSPYWNIPQSIVNKDIIPGLSKHGESYLTSHRMERNGNGGFRQLPGENNSLGLVKFIFPNSNNIYLHDTPSKNLFNKESRAFSHGCIRVGKPRDLAVSLLSDDKNWNPGKIDKAMHLGKENSYVLKQKIPVIIGYFTAWVDDNGDLNFYEDVYGRDKKLSNLLIN